MRRRTILTIIDKPKHPQTALERSLALQSRMGGHLQLVAFAYHAMYDQHDLFDARQRRAIRREIVRQRTEWLRDQVRDAQALDRDLSLEVIWVKGIAEWVAERAAEQGIDLVVKSVHQRPGALLRTPLDWQLLRLCPAPLLLCSATPWRRKPRVLAAVDLRTDDRAHATLNRRVLEAAHEFAELHDGELHCVYAVDAPKVLSELAIPDPRAFKLEAVARGRQRLGELAAPFGISDERVHVPMGKVGHAVNRVAERLKANLLVMGTTARRGVAARVIGNSAEKVLIRARCDVLALKP